MGTGAQDVDGPRSETVDAVDGCGDHPTQAGDELEDDLLWSSYAWIQFQARHNPVAVQLLSHADSPLDGH